MLRGETSCAGAVLGQRSSTSTDDPCHVAGSSPAGAALPYMDDGATLDDLREAVTTVEGAGRIARRVLGGAHPLTTVIERDSRNMRAALLARELRQS